MDITIHTSWQKQLSHEFKQPYYTDLMRFIKKEYIQNTCYPPRNEIFSAFDHCPFDKTKVIIIGQDPYHRPNQANGLCFSVNDRVLLPPSLRNIFNERETDLGKPFPSSGNLQRWAGQGVLLLNATLTVRAYEAGSHQNKGWELFTNAVIKKLSAQKNDLVFLLWGGFAKKKTVLIDAGKHHILTSGHPSPLSANRGYWFGSRHFSKTNAILTKLGKRSIDW